MFFCAAGALSFGRSAPNVASREAPIFNLPEEAFIAEVRRFNGIPREVLDRPETKKLFLPVLGADLEMLDTYEYYPEERLSCPITVYGGLQLKVCALGRNTPLQVAA